MLGIEEAGLIVAVSFAFSFLSFKLMGGLLSRSIGRKIFKLLKSQDGGNAQGKVDIGVTKALLRDMTAPESPIGAVLQFFPNVVATLEEDPKRVTGLINLIASVPNLLNVVGLMKGAAGGNWLEQLKAGKLNNPATIEVLKG